MNYQEYQEMVNRPMYRKAFAKCNVTASTLADLQNMYRITERVDHVIGREIVSSTTEEVTAEQYANVCSSVCFFNDRVIKEYTMAGYIATGFTARNPYNKADKFIRRYTFDYVGFKG